MGSSHVYDSGRDDFLVRATSTPPSKYDSIEDLECDVHERSTIAFKISTEALAKKNSTTDGRFIGRSTCSSSSSKTSYAGRWSGSRVQSEAIQTSSWREEVSGRPLTAPCRPILGLDSEFKTPAGVPKKFLWGPKVSCQQQRGDWDVRRTNKGDPATFAMAVEECPSSVSSIRSVVPRKLTTSMNVDDSTIGESSAYFGMEPYVRTAFTDRIHDGIYDIDKAHKATLASRLKGNEVRVPHISRYGKRFLGFEASLGRERNIEPGHYDIERGVDATSVSSTFLSLPRQTSDCYSYIRRGLGQTTGSAIGPGKYRWELTTSQVQGPLAFSNLERWTTQEHENRRSSSSKGPWDDVDVAWGRGGYIERYIPRDCQSYLPAEIMSYVTSLNLDHFGKESLVAAVQRNPIRYAASFSNTQVRNEQVIGDPSPGPGAYDVKCAEDLTRPAPLGGAGDADPTRPSLSFRARFTPFDTRRLAHGYKTLKPRFSTPRSPLYASELSGFPKVPAATANTALKKQMCMRKQQNPAARMAAVKAAAAADPWRIGGRCSRFVRLERPSVLGTVRGIPLRVNVGHGHGGVVVPPSSKSKERIESEGATVINSFQGT